MHRKMRLFICSLSALPWLLLLFLLVGNTKSEPGEEYYKTYIIHMDHSQKPSSFLTYESWHRSILRSLSEPVDDEEMFLYSYNHAIHGFSARLKPSQLSEIKKSPAHIALHEDYVGNLLTTHSPSFLGLRHSSGLWPASSYGEGVIIGLIDSGIWPESESFNDRGMPPIPERWKGKCDNSSTTGPFPCNRKLIGARTFNKAIQGNKSDEEDTSPRDLLGHGTHTASTAAGNHVPGVSQFGYAKGTARGMAPRSYLAMYKVSYNGSIAASDILAAMDQAIADGVDVLSLSLTVGIRPYFDDVIAIASLSAIEKGIFVAAAAGNFGDFNSTVNGAPWITTVGAGTLDRSFIATATLGNGLTFEGESTFPLSVLITNSSLYYGKNDSKKAVCNFESLNANETAGKVVFCDNPGITIIGKQINELSRIGAYAGIIAAEHIPYFAGLTIPILVINMSSGALIKEYAIRETEAQVKTMRFVLTKLGTKPAPEVADFSSRGPDPINPAILKPDVIAPGVDILAAIPSFSGISFGNHELVTDYAFKSGTSMSTPHVSGVAALLKAVHPDWSPAAIRSALMTTAYSIDNNGTVLRNQSYDSPATPLDYGSGHINPNKAMDPGLIYDMDKQDYIDFLCSLGYNETAMKAVLRQSQWNCTQKEITDLNYPSIVAMFSNEPNFPKVMNFSRVVMTHPASARGNVA